MKLSRNSIKFVSLGLTIFSLIGLTSCNRFAYYETIKKDYSSVKEKVENKETFFLLLFSYECYHCGAEQNNYKTYFEKNANYSIVAVDVDSLSKEDEKTILEINKQTYLKNYQDNDYSFKEDNKDVDQSNYDSSIISTLVTPTNLLIVNGEYSQIRFGITNSVELTLNDMIEKSE